MDRAGITPFHQGGASAVHDGQSGQNTGAVGGRGMGKTISAPLLPAPVSYGRHTNKSGARFLVDVMGVLRFLHSAWTEVLRLVRRASFPVRNSYKAPVPRDSTILVLVARHSAAVAGEEGAGNGEAGSGTAVIAKTKTQTRRPSMYRVLILNDDYTPMEFVVQVLRLHFNKSLEEATRIMLHVHHHGVGECGVYTFEVAETKVTQVMDFARKHQHPLQCIMEKK